MVDIDTHNHDRYWLSYCVWDVLYVGGPDAKKVIHTARHLFAEDETIPTGGSLIDLSLMQRKCILHNLIKVIPKVIEHVRGVVVRPDGSVEDDPSTYYLGTGKQEYGTIPAVLDSISLAICSSRSSATTRFDKQRKAGRTDDEIEKIRAIALDDMYEQVVMTLMQEGLMLKDLMSPYYLGEKGRRIKCESDERNLAGPALH